MTTIESIVPNDIVVRTRELNAREKELVRLLWDYLPKDKEHKDRRKTAWGTKTQVGLCNIIAFIMDAERRP